MRRTLGDWLNKKFMTSKADVEKARDAIENWFGGYRIRAYQPDADYEATSYIHPDALYLADQTFVVTVVRSSFADLGESWPEMFWLLPAEVRLLASIALAVPEGYGGVSFVPTPTHTRISIPAGAELDSVETLQYLRSEAARVCAPLLGEQPLYQLRSVTPQTADRTALFKSIDLSDALLMRGLYCLLKSQHLIRTEMFGEEAVMNVQIAREAALELIRRRLRANGSKDPSYADAHAYIRDNFRKGQYLASFLEEEHDLWIAVRHPESRFGSFWTPPLMLNHWSASYFTLISIYRHLLLNERGRATARLGR